MSDDDSKVVLAISSNQYLIKVFKYYFIIERSAKVFAPFSAHDVINHLTNLPNWFSTVIISHTHLMISLPPKEI